MNAPKPRLWPRIAVSPEGNRARFGCAGDVPHGWTLETPLPGDEYEIENVYAEAPKRGPGRPRKVAS